MYKHSNVGRPITSYVVAMLLFNIKFQGHRSLFFLTAID